MKITMVRDELGRVLDENTCSAVVSSIQNTLKRKGYDNEIDSRTNACSFNISNIRLNQEYVDNKGRNVSPWSGRRGRILNWDNWVEVNNTINGVLDKYGLSANASSLHGKFKIREGTKKYTENDWKSLGTENVGSEMQPVMRRDAWASEK